MSKKVDWSAFDLGKLEIVDRAVQPAHVNVKKGNYWNCKCECGALAIVRTDHLTSGKIKSCGSASCGGSNFQDLAGVKRGKLIPTQRVDKPVYINKRGTYWSCKCDCGNIVVVRGDHLTSGRTESCGCVGIHDSAEEAKITSAKSAFRQTYDDGDLTFEDFVRLTQQNCAYCQSPPTNSYNIFKYQKKSGKFSIENGTYVYNGLDRVDSSQRHNLNNCVPCCKHCNYAKSDMTLDQFRQLIDTLYEHVIVKDFSVKCFSFFSYTRCRLDENSYKAWITNVYTNLILGDRSSALQRKSRNCENPERSLH